MKTLYFDIDGVLLDYDDNQRPKLASGELESRLKHLNFERLICVSGWADIFNFGTKPLDAQKAALHELLNQIFPDKTWFMDRIELAYDTDHRCRHIDLSRDWYYIDDWADKFFTEHFGQSHYKKELGQRILLVNPHGDGSDILGWLDTVLARRSPSSNACNDRTV